MLGRYRRSYIYTALLFMFAVFFNTHEAVGRNISERSVSVEDSLRGDTVDMNDLKMYDPKSHLFERPVFINAKYSGGKVLGDIRNIGVCYAQYSEVKVGVTALGNRWMDIVYGMPYYGLGVGFYDFGSPKVGKPISVYLLQGGTLKSYSKRSMIKYEWNFGTSFNWKRYNAITNPENTYVGAPINIYFAANFYHTYILSKELDLNAGITFNHVSNGATRMPNSGVNSLTATVGLTYYLDRERILNEYNPSLRAPVYTEKRLISDVSLHTTFRQRKFSPEKTGLSSKYIDKEFFIAGASYAFLHMSDYKHRYGTSLEFIYDESAGFSARKIGENPDGSDIVQYDEGSFLGCLSLGISARGDFVMPRYSVSGQLGCDVIKGKKTDSRYYQIFSVRVPLGKTFYASFILRTQKFSKAQYMFFGIGYMIDHRPYRMK